jgi:hypothetical protein
LFEARVVHPDLAALAALSAPHEYRAAARLEVELGQIERLLDAQPGAPEHHDQAAGAVAVESVAAATHHLNDLLGPRRVGRIPATLTARPSPSEIAGHGGRGSAATERIQRRRSRHDNSSWVGHQSPRPTTATASRAIAIRQFAATVLRAQRVEFVELGHFGCRRRVAREGLGYSKTAGSATWM